MEKSGEETPGIDKAIKERRRGKGEKKRRGEEKGEGTPRIDKAIALGLPSLPPSLLSTPPIDSLISLPSFPSSSPSPLPPYSHLPHTVSQLRQSFLQLKAYQKAIHKHENYEAKSREFQEKIHKIQKIKNELMESDQRKEQKKKQLEVELLGLKRELKILETNTNVSTFYID